MIRPVIHTQSTNVTYILEMHKPDEMVRQVINQQKATYILKMHKPDRQVIYAQSTKDHLQSENAQMKKWSDRSLMLNQEKVTYILEMHK